ncbi:MAG: secondary thiamine-phosphate synthase enzyme YjbQ [bacterium]
MKSYRRVLSFTTEEAEEVLNITEQCESALSESGVTEGIMLVFPLHTSSSVFISDSDFSVALDYQELLENLAPALAGYRHDETDPKKNAHGHLRSVLTGHHITCPVTEGRLDFGSFHTIYYLELDGRRPKEVLVKIIGE